MYKRRLLLVTVMLILLSISDLIAQTLSEGKEFGTAESVVTELYKSVTFEPGNTPDWQKVQLSWKHWRVVCRQPDYLLAILQND